MTNPPALVAPTISSQGGTLAALAVAGAALQGVQGQQLQVVAGTVTSSPQNLTVAGPQLVTLVLDTAPSTPLTAHVLNGRSPQLGARVMVLLYPPRGLVVLGEISDSALSTQIFSNGFGASADIQLYDGTHTAAGNLNFQRLGGQVVLGATVANTTFTAPALSTQSVRDLTSHAGLNSTSFAVIGTAALIPFIWPESGQVMVNHKTRITAATAAGTYFADVIVKNVTAGTTPYGGSTNNGFAFTAAGVLATTVDICGWNVIGSAGSGGIGTVGTPGDVMLCQIAYTVTAGSWTASEVSIAVSPSV